MIERFAQIAKIRSLWEKTPLDVWIISTYHPTNGLKIILLM